MIGCVYSWDKRTVGTTKGLVRSATLNTINYRFPADIMSTQTVCIDHQPVHSWLVHTQLENKIVHTFIVVSPVVAVIFKRNLEK